MPTTDQAADLFATAAHNPSFHAIRAQGGHAGELLDFCVPVNAYFPPAALMEQLRAHLPEIVKYYPDYADVHQDCVAALTGLPAENIVVGNGSTELITSVCRDLKGPIVTWNSLSCRPKAAFMSNSTPLGLSRVRSRSTPWAKMSAWGTVRTIAS